MKTKLKKLSKRTISIVLTLVMLVSMAIVGMITSNAINVKNDSDIYFDNSVTQFTDGQIYFIIWHDKDNGAYGRAVKMNKVTNTNNLYYLDYEAGDWTDAWYYGVAQCSSGWNAGSWGTTNYEDNSIKHINKIGGENTDINANTTHLITGGTLSSGTEYNRTYGKIYDNNESGGYYGYMADNLKSTQNVQTKVYNYSTGNYDTLNDSSVATVDIAGRQMSAYNSAGTTGSAGMGASASYNTVKTSNVTLSYSIVDNSYEFVGWYNSSGTEVGTGSTYTYSADVNNTTYYAYFKLSETKHDLDVIAGSNGKVSVNGGTAATGTQTVNVGTYTTATLNAVPDAGYSFTNWTVTSGVTGVANGDSTTSVTIGADDDGGTITANFTEKAIQTVTITAPTNGSVTVTGSSVSGNSSVTANSGDASDTTFTAHVDDVLTITTTPDAGYKLQSMTAAGQVVTSGDTYTVVADTNPTISATFEETTSYRIKVFAGTGGTTTFTAKLYGESSSTTTTITANQAQNFDVDWDSGFTVAWTTSSGYTFSKTSKNGTSASTTDNSNVTGTSADDGAVYKTEWATAWPPSGISYGSSQNNQIVYIDASGSQKFLTDTLSTIPTYYNSNDHYWWADLTSLISSKSNNIYFSMSNTSTYSGIWQHSNKADFDTTNASGLSVGDQNGHVDNTQYYFGGLYIIPSNVTKLGVKIVDDSSNNKFKYYFYTSTGSSSGGDSDYDPFYVGGRFTINNGSTDVHAGTDEWNFDIDSTSIKWTKDNDTGYYKLETNKTIAELSPMAGTGEYAGTYTDQLFIVHDTVNNYAISAADYSGKSFQNYNSASNALTLNPVENPQPYHELMFDDLDNTSDGKVVIWIDARDYAEGNSASALKIWYTVEDETPAVADKLAFSISPQTLTVNNNATLTATISDVDSNISNPNTQLQFVFEKYNGSTWDAVATVTGDSITNPSTGKYRATTTVTNATAGSYTYRVTVSTTNSYSGKSLRSVSKSASATWKPQTVYYTSDITSSASSPTWTAVDADTKFATITTSVSSGNSYTIALSDEAVYNPDFSDFTIDSDKTKYCDIKMGSKTVTIDNEDRVVRTYVVTPRTNCSNPTIYINSATNTIYAIATFDKYGDSEKTLSNTTEKVKYYFAKPADKDYDGTNNLDGTKGLNVKYYNNSVTSKTETKWAVPVKADGTTSSGSYSATSVQYTGGNSDASDYQIKVDKSQLFRNTTENSAYSSTSNDWVTCNVYVLEMPIWATSANFCSSSGSTQLGSPILALNPNRIYVFWSTGDSDKQWSGVPLDTSFWVSEQTSGTHKRGDTGYENNQVPLKSFKTNLINYNTSADWSETMNSALSGVYSTRNISRTLYWGMFANGNPSGLTNWDIALNLAQRKNDQSYYASVWESVNPELSKDTNNSNPLEGGLLTAYGSDQIMPFFDYSYLSGSQNVGTAYTNKDFPFYSSTFDNVTTYSYDSMVDLNRHYDVSNGAYEVENQTVKLGANLGYAPFHGESVTDTAAGFANEYDINFYMTTTGKIQGTNENHDICFNFSGDDDVWVFVDGVLVLDLGGAHKISAGSINFSDMKVYYKTAATDFTSGMGTSNDWATSSNYVYTMDLQALLDAYGVDFSNTDATTKHTLQMFYTERGRLESNMSLSFNLPQASGLNVRNTVLADNVNAGLKDAALAASNEDYFTYKVGNATATDAAITTLKGTSGYENALLPSTTSQWSASNVSPLFPYKTEVNRVFGGESLALASTSDSRTQTGGSVISSLSSSWSYLNNSVYALTDKYAQSTAEDAKLSGITDSSTGAFHLLGGEMANFTDKVRPNSYVQVQQTQELGGVNSSGNVIQYASVSDNNVGNYYTTSYDIYDEAAKKNIVNETNYNIAYGNNDTFYATDESAADNGFYFTNYAGDSSSVNPAMTVNFYNNIAVGSLRVAKEVTNSSTANDNFYFKVEFAQIFGETDVDWAEYDVDYKIYNIEDDTLVSSATQSYGTVGIVIKPGQYALIEGVPVETRFRVTEMSRAGYSLVDIDKTATKPNGNEIDYTVKGLTTGFYNYLDQGNSSLVTLDKTATSSGDTYYCNMVPTVSETYVSGRNYVSISTVTYSNKKENFTIQFKYYDRYEIDGETAGINSSATTYSVSLDSIPSQFITYVDGDEAKGVASINFANLIGANATEFAESTLNVSNVMCDYNLWTSQSAAATAMASKTYFDNGVAKSYGENTTYHTTYLGQPQTSGEKWVSYYDSKGTELAETSFVQGSDYLKVRTIVVWCYNYPKQYDVDIYGANDATDLVQKTVGENTVYVANASGSDSTVKSLSNKFYYNQRFGYSTGLGSQDEAGFISNYGIPGAKSDVLPINYAAETFGSGDDTYTFAYWAYDQAGTQVASVDRAFMYRVTTDTKIYAVYTKGSTYGTTPGVSLSANDNDTYVDSNGVSRTRLNILASVYNAVPYDTNVQKLAFVNISLSSQIRSNPSVYTPAKITELFENYQTQLKSIIEAHEATAPFSITNQLFNGGINTTTGNYDSTINLTLTTKGYVYTVTSNGNEAGTGESTIELTNKNRAQFTISYKTSALNIDGTNTNGNTCLMYSGAMKYNGTWNISNNCLIYYNGHVVDNAATSWS